MRSVAFSEDSFYSAIRLLQAKRYYRSAEHTPDQGDDRNSSCKQTITVRAVRNLPAGGQLRFGGVRHLGSLSSCVLGSFRQ
ncbi:hypothetical protein BaRGS_00032167 [Batillaria attramentaria]|uniref:Uncharacterized protein n=1 Tax=Batillaria attramentaria TaxID=370345 RepID=A0ABD0JP73_9CAEN